MRWRNLRLSGQAMVMLLMLSSGTLGAVDGVKINAITNAADQFIALAKDSSTTGHPPRETDPAAKPLLDLVFDVSEIRAGPVLPTSALGNVSAWTLAVNKVGTIYTLSGTGLTDLAAVSNNPDVLRNIDQNTVEFAPEMGRYFDAVLWLERSMMDTVAAFLANASKAEIDRARDGIAKFRAGGAQTIFGVITTMGIDGLSNEWRHDRLAVLTAVAPSAAKILLPEDRRALHDTATNVASRMPDPALRDALNAVGTTLLAR